MNARIFTPVHDPDTEAAATVPMILSLPRVQNALKAAPKAHKVILPTMEGLCFEKIKHIAFLEASGNYTVLHFIDGRHVLVCKTLREVEDLLPAAAFVRIHRSHSIHLKHLKKYIRGKGGQVVLQNGVTLAVSAGQKAFFLDSLKQYFG